MYLTLFSFLLMSFETILKIVSASNIVSVFTSETIHIHHTRSRLCVSTGGLRHAVATLWRSKGGKSGIFASLPKREFVVRGSAGRSLTHSRPSTLAWLTSQASVHRLFLPVRIPFAFHSVF